MDLKKVGKFIAENRKEKGYTQEVLGEKLGITSNIMWSLILSGDS